MESVKPIFRNGDKIILLDQTRLPNEVFYKDIGSLQEMYQWIKELKIRGAPAIGIAGAYGLYIALREYDLTSLDDGFKRLEEASSYLISSRPTAVNLKWAIDRVNDKVRGVRSLDELLSIVLAEADLIRAEDEDMCYKIGLYGSELLKDFNSVLTHCNAGSIATARYGTALSPIYYLKDHGKELKVFADETRPLLQGSRLTTWELMEAGIDVTLITDSMAGVVMSKGLVDCVIVGADRIASNGDTANKIGTYGLSILAREHNIPFYIAAPSSTFDLSISSGADIEIEERDPIEVLRIGDKFIAPPDAKVFNPAFDVTSGDNITAIITEKGIIYPPFRENIGKIIK